MTTDNIRSEMQAILKEGLETRSFDTLVQCLTVYEQTYGQDSFYIKIANSFVIDEPLISLICLNICDEEIDTFLSNQHYYNIELVKVTDSDSYEDLVNFFSLTTSSYICFLEPNHIYTPYALPQMVNYLLRNECDMVITARNFINNSGTIIAHPDYIYPKPLPLLDSIVAGKSFFEFCLTENINLFGTLSTCMASTQYVQKIVWTFPNCQYDEIMKFSLLSQLIINGSVGYIDTPLIATQAYDYRDETYLQESFKQYITDLNTKGSISVPDNTLQVTNRDYSEIKKHITFFHTDKGEYYNLKPIADEAQKRGYEVTFTENILQKAEIGIYCQHICFPENSKFSVILLHDMAQGHNRWPNLWERERWNKFDIGILPGPEWSKRWEECACQYYANPRLGAYAFGYPKSDIINTPGVVNCAQKLRAQFNLKYNFSVLYAPSWENDNKEDDFVRALASLPINLLIKQAHWPDAYSEIIENIRQMRLLHEGKFDNVYYIEPEESILTALELCDMVVSDESSVMTEAILFNKPSIAVCDWLIPDTTPHRYASVPMDYVLKCKKDDLREYVEKLAFHPEIYADAQKIFTDIFSNQGNCCNDILDTIDYYTQSRTNCSFMNKKLTTKYTPFSMWN